jgi:muconolactone delta-isomerase
MRCLVSSSFVPGTEAARAALLPAEQAHVKRLMEQGILEAGYLAADRAHLWMVLQGESQDQVAEVLKALPFYPFMEPELTPLLDIIPGGGGDVDAVAERFDR